MNFMLSHLILGNYFSLASDSSNLIEVLPNPNSLFFQFSLKSIYCFTTHHKTIEGQIYKVIVTSPEWDSSPIFLWLALISVKEIDNTNNFAKNVQGKNL